MCRSQKKQTNPETAGVPQKQVRQAYLAEANGQVPTHVFVEATPLMPSYPIDVITFEPITWKSTPSSGIGSGANSVQ